jgi:conjugal transfer pilus assembly protein TraK
MTHSLYAIGAVTAGTTLASRQTCLVSRAIGAGLIGLAVMGLASPAMALGDQTLMASDGSQVQCNASARDLTRISLVEDEFASVSKINTGNPADDFSVVNEPVRGDIYLSVPEGFARPALSFFATSKRGYVYKFICNIAGDQAVQVFISNPAIARAELAEAGLKGPAQASGEEKAIELVQAMYGGRIVDGYEMRQRSMRPVYVGDLKVQMIAEYRGDDLTGRVLRIENKGAQEKTLTEASVAPASSLAVSIAEPKLAPGKVTTAYLVSRTGN